MNNTNQDDAILRALKEAASFTNSEIKSIDTQLYTEAEGPRPVILQESQTAYYVATENIKFRHEGVEDEIPPRLYLGDLREEGTKTLVYYTSSGSGKTSELVGSSVSRGAHLSFVFSINDLEEDQYNAIEERAEENLLQKERYLCTEMTSPGSQEPDPSSNGPTDADVKWRLVNRMAADATIKPLLSEMVSRAKEEIECVLQAAIDSKQTLRLVLAIDEASSCPRAVRGIIRFPAYMKRLVFDTFFDLCSTDGIDENLLEILISVGGTGVASATMGSLQKNFSIPPPFHQMHWKTIVESKLKAENFKAKVSWDASLVPINSLDDIRHDWPVLFEMMQNGRLASIALAELRTCVEKRQEIQEAVLVNKIIKRFMRSNGMSLLVKRPNIQREVAASALAVHLFRELDAFKVKVPTSGIDVEDWATEMSFFEFSTKCNLRALVKEYGLLEPDTRINVNEERGKWIVPPILMTRPQQLVAVCMLGLDIESMLQPTWFGFEMMSTHFVKCALSASLAVCQDKRPSVKCALASVGFSVDSKATSEAVQASWNQLDDFKVAATAPATGQETVYHTHTSQLAVGLKILYNDDGQPMLQIEKNLLSALMNSKGSKRIFALPITCVNEGNSSLCDGIVSFYAWCNTNNELQKISIMVQAKDYSEGSTLGTTKLNEHADALENKVLNGAFGERRLLCVASCHSKLKATNNISNKRDYLPFQVNDSLLLDGLGEQLRAQRCERDRIAKHAVFCDSKGTILNFTKVNRKRKLDE